jgi:glycosyltransferase involved in cell wall biosynthesis
MNEQKAAKGPRCDHVLLSYNHEAYVELALEGVFSQVGADKQMVIVCDDSSTDASREVIVRWLSARGLEPVRLFSARNLGTAATLRKAALAAQGELIIISASDDVSLPTRTRVIRENIESLGEKIYGGFSDVTAINDKGDIIDPADRPNFTDPNLDAESIARNFTGFLGASSFYHRDVFGRFGPLTEGLLHEDMVLNFRAALLGRTIFLRQKLVRYRQHLANVHSLRRKEGPQARLEHALKIGRSLVKVAEQRCIDLVSARQWLPRHRADVLWKSCVYWRSTHRMKMAALSGRLPLSKAFQIALFGQSSCKEIAKAIALRMFVKIWMKAERPATKP